MMRELIERFGALSDPRDPCKVEHRLVDILVIAVCAVVGAAESFEDIAPYGRCKQDWLRGFLELRGGIPSHDTFRRVLALIDPERFERCLLDWVRSVFRLDAAPRQAAIDGKRRCCIEAYDPGGPSSPPDQATRSKLGLAARIMRSSASTATATSPRRLPNVRARSRGPIKALQRPMPVSTKPRRP